MVLYYIGVGLYCALCVGWIAHIIDKYKIDDNGWQFSKALVLMVGTLISFVSLITAPDTWENCPAQDISADNTLVVVESAEAIFTHTRLDDRKIKYWEKKDGKYLVVFGKN